MNRSEKAAFVESFEARVRGTQALYLTDFTGLDVPSMTGLRRRLKDAGAEFLVVKNRLARRAFEDLGAGFPDLSEHLTGPTGVVFGTDGPVEAAKVLNDFAKEHGARPAFKVGVVDGVLVDAAHYERLARLPPMEQLLAMVAGAMEGKLQEFAALIDALREQRASSAGDRGPEDSDVAGEDSGDRAG